MDEAPTERIAIVRNPRSGTAPEVAALEQALSKARVSARICNIPDGQDIDAWLDRLANDFDVIAASGGDGTVSSVANAIAKADRTLAVLPTGTLNHFARDTGIPTDLDAAIELLRTGRQQRVDVGTVNGRLFPNNVSLGNYPRMVRERTGLVRRGIPKRVAGAIAAFDTWWDLRNMSFALTLDGQDLFRRSPFIVIANGSYDLSGLNVGERPQINDGRLSVYIAPRSGRLGALMLPLRALAGTLEQHDQFETLSATAMSATIRHSRSAAGIDGELRDLESPLEFGIRRQALRVLVPRKADQ